MSALVVATMLAMLCALPTSWATDIDEREDDFSPTFCKDRPSGNYPDPNSCQSYYTCSHGSAIPRSCPRGLLYNSEEFTCDWPNNVQCESPPGESAVTESESESETESESEPESESESEEQSTTGQLGGCKYRVCYFTNWAQYRQGGAKQFADDVDASLCSHIIYAFAELVGNRLQGFEWNDESTPYQEGQFAKILKLKAGHPNLKILLAVGGWNMGSAVFSFMAKTPKSRSEFVSTSIAFLRRIGFDGLDMDWEYPANRGGIPQDKENFISLMQELRDAFIQEAVQSNKPRLLLTVAVGAGKKVVDSAYDVPALNDVVDFINLMTYDLHGAWENVTGHNSPLYAGRQERGSMSELNVAWAAKYWASKGASKDKLVIGLPLYGRTFTLKSTSHTGVGAPVTGAGKAGKYTRKAGFLAYYEVCNMMNPYFLQDQKVRYVVQGNQWVGYDDRRSLAKKVQFVLDNGYAGVMMWDISLDDMKGSFCDMGPYPLMHAINAQCQSASR